MQPLRRLILAGLTVVGSLATTSRAAVVDVTDYGAVPGDGIDDTVAINAAIAAAASGGTVLIPAGVFDVSSQVLATGSVTITGGGRDATILRRTGTSTAPLLRIQGTTGANIGNLTLDANNSTAATAGIRATNSTGLSVHDVAVSNLATATGFAPHGIWLDSGVTQSTIANCSISNIGASSQWGAGIRVSGGSAANRIVGNTIAGIGRGGILCDGASTDLLIKGNVVTGSGGTGLGIELFGGCDRAVVEDNRIDHWLSVDASSNVAVRRNVVSDTTGAYKYAGLELVDARDCVFTDNVVDGGQQLGISISGAAPKQRILWAHNAVRGASTWGLQLQGDDGGASRMYFYRNSFSGTLRNAPATLFAPQGHGVRINEDADHIVFDSNWIEDNQGSGVQLLAGSSAAPTLSAIDFVNNAVTRNGGSALSASSPSYLRWINNDVFGNGSNAEPPETSLLRPRAVIFAPTLAEVGSPVTFPFAPPPGFGDFADVLWDFGDGLPSTVPNATHVYGAPGTYRVTLLGWTAGGDAALSEGLITVTAATSHSLPEPAGSCAVIGVVLHVAGWRRRAVTACR